jgi:hypothetical protein
MAIASKAVKVKVQVHFPLAPGGPYKATQELDTTVGEVRRAAMSHFGVDENPGSRYYLVSRKDEEVADEVTLGSVDEEGPGKGTIKFTLVKELIQG